MSEIMQGFLDKLSDLDSKKEPDVPVNLPLGIFPAFTQHRTQLHLKLDIQKRGMFNQGDLYKTSVRDAQSGHEIFNITPIETVSSSFSGKVKTQTLFSSNGSPILTLTTERNWGHNQWICRIASNGEEVFRAEEKSNWGTLSCRYTFANRLGKGEPINIKMKKEGFIEAYKLHIGSLSCKKKEVNLTVNPGVDVSLMVISVMCLHRMVAEHSSGAAAGTASGGC